jgi:hypothetical protein
VVSFCVIALFDESSIHWDVITLVGQDLKQLE